MIEFGKWLKATRKSLELKQKDIADMTGINPSTICGYEKDNYTPSLYAVEAIADALGYEVVLRKHGTNE